MNKPLIIECIAREILDSRGNPTVEVTVSLSDGTTETASVPSGASTGIYEAVEKRDGDSSRYGGKGVLSAVNAVNTTVSKAIVGMSVSDQTEIDSLLVELDGTEDRSGLGANAILATSLACARSAAAFYRAPLFKHLGGIAARRLPCPMMNILNGGAHASNNVEIQEFMIVPRGFARFSDALRAGSEIYHTLGKILRARKLTTTVGDEGGYAPNLDSDEQALELILKAIDTAGYSTEQVGIALDAAASEWCSEGTGYRLPKRGVSYSTDELIDYWCSLCDRFPAIMSIEDPLDQRDEKGWISLTTHLGKRIMLVGDDLFVTNKARLAHGINVGEANAILIKPNQVGTLTETLSAISLARESGYGFIISHRSGETEDTTIADLSVATNAAYIKTGAPCRSDRVAKYNRLLRIEEALGESAVYGR